MDGRSRAHAPRHERSPEPGRCALPARVSRQSGGRCGAPRDAALRLPDRATLNSTALVPGGGRRVHGDMDERRRRPGAGWLRRDGVPGDGARQRQVLRPARTRVERHRDRLPDRSQRLPLWHALHGLPRAHLWPATLARLVAARCRQPALLRRRLPAGIRPAARTVVAAVDRLGARVPAAEPAGRARASAHRVPRPHSERPRRRLTPLPLGGRVQGFRRREVSRAGRAHRVDCPRRWQGDGTQGGQGRQWLHGNLARLRSRDRDSILHDEQQHPPQPRGPRPALGQVAHAAAGCADRGHRLQPGRSLAVGPEAQQRFRHGCADPLPL